MKIAAIVQARMGSSRLPGKVMMDLRGHPVLQRVVNRCYAANKIDTVIVATEHGSKEVIDYCKDNFIEVFVGSQSDVMGRVLCAADAHGVDVIVDITADCPVIDPSLIDDCVSRFLGDTTLDYVSNCVPIRSFPDGMDCQVYTFDALREVYEFTDSKTRNHVGWNIPQYPDRFRCACIQATGDAFWPDLRLTLDTMEDFHLIEYLYSFFYGDLFGLDMITRLLRISPDIIRNRNVRTKLPEEG